MMSKVINNSLVKNSRNNQMNFTTLSPLDSNFRNIRLNKTAKKINISGRGRNFRSNNKGISLVQSGSIRSWLESEIDRAKRFKSTPKQDPTRFIFSPINSQR